MSSNSIYIPYFYIIQDVRNGMYYAGSKYGKDANPANFMTESGYQTSSGIVKELIEQHGLKNFVVRKIKTFETGKDAHDYETRFLQRVDARGNSKFYNGHNNDWNDFDLSKYRKSIIIDGLTSYQLGARKGVETKRSKIIDGKNLFQIAYEKALTNNPNLNNIRKEKSIEAMSSIDQVTGLSKFELRGLKIRGENNPSKNPENARKISIALKNYINENKNKWESDQEYRNFILDKRKDKNGLTARDRHSIWMKENNPTKNSIWCNNGSRNIRIKDLAELPDGFVVGKIHFTKRKPSFYCNDGFRNIRVTEGEKIPEGFVKGFLKKK